MLFNVHTNQWDDELLALLRIPKALLPEVLPSAAHFGDTAPTCWAIPSASAAWRATSKARCSARPASHGRHGQEHLRHPAASCCCIPGGNVFQTRPERPADHQRGNRPGGNPEFAMEGSGLSAAPWCSGCATACAPSPTAARWSRSPKACPIRAA